MSKHVVLSKHMALTTSVDPTFMTIYDLSNHFPVAVDIEFTLFLEKPVFDSYSFGGANYHEIADFMLLHPFQPNCYTNIDKMNDECDEYLNSIFQRFIPRKTKHRQSLPPWFSHNTSHLLKRLNTQRLLFQSKPSSY